ncbi:MAG: hypothetical protein LXA09_03325 [Gemmatimonadetes bacterium]|jgi:hypothetical protein|nr:hypothetical protein [Gemmatimonadota bacterium]
MGPPNPGDLGLEPLDGGGECRGERARIGLGEELAVAGSTERDLDASGVPVTDESHDGVDDLAQARGKAVDGRFGLGAK